MLCDSLEVWDGEGSRGRFKRERTYVCLWLIRVDVWQKLSLYCKVFILQLKIKLFYERNIIFHFLTL